MKFERIDLKNIYNLEHTAILEIMVPEIVDFKERKSASTVLILPGGGYSFISNRERDPVAIAYMKKGFIAATLTYSVNNVSTKFDMLFPTPYLEVACAMDYLRKNKDKYFIDDSKLGLVGFSAGGHLAASFAYLYKHNDLFKTINVEKNLLRPDYLILGYPVISFSKHFHSGSFQMLANSDPLLGDLLSVEKHIENDYPPTFIWNTLEDKTVNPLNGNLLVNQLKERNIKNQYIQFPHGPHGLSLVDENTVLNETEIEEYKDVSTWLSSSIEFIKSI